MRPDLQQRSEGPRWQSGRRAGPTALGEAATPRGAGVQPCPGQGARGEEAEKGGPSVRGEQGREAGPAFARPVPTSFRCGPCSFGRREPISWLVPARGLSQHRRLPVCLLQRLRGAGLGMALKQKQNINHKTAGKKGSVPALPVKRLVSFRKQA